MHNPVENSEGVLPQFFGLRVQSDPQPSEKDIPLIASNLRCVCWIEWTERHGTTRSVPIAPELIEASEERVAGVWPSGEV
ncbi:MAG: hypothetical protein QOJ87_304 [Verrucomicrobiota bacterium]